MPRHDIRELNRRAVQASVEVVSQVDPGDLGRPTPCSQWSLGELLAHMTIQHRGFAAPAPGAALTPAGCSGRTTRTSDSPRIPRCVRN